MASSPSGSQRRRTANHGPDWSELPADVTLKILEKLGPEELLERTQMVCRTWRNISKDPSLWRSIDSSRFEGRRSRRTKKKMMMRAVDLSCGQLVDATIEGHKTLHYAAHRSSQLRRLVIRHCPPFYLMDAVSSLPSLEELHVKGELPSAFVLETIGSCCQQLKSLKLEKDFYWCVTHSTDKDALAIGRTMTELRHLSLDGSMLTSSGLEAILDGCPHLKSLTLFDGDSDLAQSLAKRYPVRIDCVTMFEFEHCMIPNAANYYDTVGSDSE